MMAAWTIWRGMSPRWMHATGCLRRSSVEPGSSIAAEATPAEGLGAALRQPEPADRGDALSPVAARAWDVVGGEAANGVDRQRNAGPHLLEPVPADAGLAGMGGRGQDRANDGEVATQGLGQRQLGRVVAVGGKRLVGRQWPFRVFAQHCRRQV